MAITLDDFNKIWASTSPLTPYEFTEANYKSGWNFIGSTPPSRQMWDFLQKQNDEKAQYIVNNFLQLSGGTMTGSIVSGGIAIKNANASAALKITGDSAEDCSNISLFPNSHSSSPGVVQLHADDGTNSCNLNAFPNGTLTWNGKTIIVGTEVEESHVFTTISASSSVNFSIAQAPKYYSVFLSGTGFANLIVTKDGGSTNKTFWVRNTSTGALSNITVKVRYIY